MVQEKSFREDLYYRLNVVPILIPPLRERKEDILPLIEDITKHINLRYGLSKTLSKGAIRVMLAYDWPGNVRELENIIERILVTEEDDLELVENLIGFREPIQEGQSYREQLDEFDKRLLLRTLQEVGSVQQAAERLAMDATTFRRKLHRYGVPRHRWMEK